MNLHISERFLYKDNELFSLPEIIKALLVFKNNIVLLVANSPTVDEQNVFCYDISGHLKWQVPKPVTIHSENYFTSIYFQESELYAYSISGVEYHLEKETGNIIDSQLIK